MPKILITPVVFNENIKVQSVMERFLKFRRTGPACGLLDYLVIDDGSTDTTTQIIEGYQEQGVKTLKHSQRKGVGAAIRTAIDYARENRYDILVIMAGNDKDNPEEIPRLLEPVLKEDFDLVQGSRYLKAGGAGGDMPTYRKIATRLHPWLFSWMTGRKMTDTTNGFRAFKLSMFQDQRINLHQAWLDTYELEPYLLFKAVILGFKVKEAPVTKIYPSRKLGYTKMQPFVGWWSILKPLFYLKMGIRR